MGYYPAAKTSVRGNSAGSYIGGPFKGVLHTTEGTTGEGAIAAFKANNSWPHFLINTVGTVWQFLDTKRAARTLRNLSGGVQTNLDSAVQIEIVGYASKPNSHSVAQMEALRKLMRWIEQDTGVKPTGPPRPFATAYGQNFLRFSGREWDNFNGWCGHCHVPENLHWDPGCIDMAKLLSGAPAPPTPPAPTPPSPGVNVPASYHTEGPFVPFTLSRPQGGYIVVGGDGGVFTYDGAPFRGSVPGLNVQAKVISAAWTPTGDGYWLLGDDGGVFTFGDASYHGGFNTLDPVVRGDRKPIGIVAAGQGYKILALDPSGDGSPFDFYTFAA